jgi:CRP/FNR family transcriptional regulator, cyclic AMP receptor protein
MQAADRFIQDYQRGDVVFAEGDIGKEMYVVAAGKVEISRAQDDGACRVLACLGAGEMFGEMALVAEGRRFGSARALEDGTQLVCIDQARFVYLVSQQPAFALSVIRVMAQRLAAVGQSETLALAGE